MSRRQQIERAAMGGDPHKTTIIKLMREFSHTHDPYTVFSDFVEVSAIAISSRVDQAQFEVREKRYLEIVGKYKGEEIVRFTAMFAALHMCYRSRIDAIGDPGADSIADSGLGDVLGEIFMALELGNARAGQFFTPFSVSYLMALMTIGDGADVRERGFVTMQEPACGSAGMVVATAQAMHQVGLSYPETLHATCVDIDPRCVHMAYVQLSLLGIPAIVVHGNALSLDVWGVWYTPAHILVGWGRKLRQRSRKHAEAAAHRLAGGEADVICPDTADELEPQGVGPARVGACAYPDVAGDADDGDVAVVVEEVLVKHTTPYDASVADLFEQLTSSGGAPKAEVTIFDRIGQMRLF